jgi:tetrahydromethanopterin S-methyltransferase subunit A
VIQGFGDFTEDDAYDDDLYLENLDVEAVEKLQRRMDEVNVLPLAKDRKNAAKALVRELNGE